MNIKIIEWEANKPWAEKISVDGVEYSNSVFSKLHGYSWQSTASGKLIYFANDKGETFFINNSKLDYVRKLEDPSLFGNKLRLRRVMCGLSQKQLAEKVGCFQQVISRYEKFENRPNATMLKRLADALDCKMDDLI